MALIVQKFGGSSVADADKIRNVARIITETYRRGHSVLAVLSAQGDTTDDLIEKSREINRNPSRREMDMLLSTGEQISIALCAMAIERMGYQAISLTGWQAGGLVGETKGGRGVGFTNCWTEDVEIRIAPFPLFDNAVSGFIGNVEEGNSVRMTNCRAAQNLRLLDLEGNVSNYQPANDLYGGCESGTPNIEASAQP